MHRVRRRIHEVVRIVVERKAPRRRATRRSSRSGNAAIGDEVCQIVDVISDAVH